MKGLKEYIAVHGRHFTLELVRDAIYNRWSSLEIRKTSEGQVYYNVSSATMGDMVYLVNLYHQVFKAFHPRKNVCMKFAFGIIGNVNAREYAFNHWILQGNSIDLRNYV